MKYKHIEDKIRDIFKEKVDWILIEKREVLISLEDGVEITFEQLFDLSKVVGTTIINLTTGTEGHAYSSVTFEPGEPTKIHCFECMFE